jgi:hypothetical protein
MLADTFDFVSEVLSPRFGVMYPLISDPRPFTYELAALAPASDPDLFLPKNPVKGLKKTLPAELPTSLAAGVGSVVDLDAGVELLLRALVS